MCFLSSLTCSRVHPQVTVHPNGLIMSRRWQSAMCDPLNQSWAHSFLDSTSLYETATWLSVTEGPLILKTERHRSVQRLRGCWEATLRPPTGESRSSDSISGDSRWTGIPNATQMKKSERMDGSLDTHGLSRGSSRTIKAAFVVNMLHNDDGRPNLGAWLILRLASASHLPRVSNTLLCKQHFRNSETLLVVK